MPFLRMASNASGHGDHVSSGQENRKDSERHESVKRDGGANSAPVLDAATFQRVQEELFMRALTGGGPRTALERQVQEAAEWMLADTSSDEGDATHLAGEAPPPNATSVLQVMLDAKRRRDEAKAETKGAHGAVTSAKTSGGRS